MGCLHKKSRTLCGLYSGSLFLGNSQLARALPEKPPNILEAILCARDLGDQQLRVWETLQMVLPGAETYSR